MQDYVMIIIMILYLLVCTRSLEWGAILFVVSHNILPPIIRVGSISLNTFLISVLMFFSFYHINKVNGNIKMSFLPLTILFFPLAILNLFAPSSYIQSYSALIKFTITELLPFIVIFLSINTQEGINKVTKAFMISYLIIGLYGIFTFIIGTNPYVIITSLLFEYEGDLFVTGVDGGRLLGVATGNTTGPLPWGQFSLLALLFSVYIYKRWSLSSMLCILVIILSFANCMMTGKRSVILPAFISIFYFFFISRKIRKIQIVRTVLMGCVVGAFILQDSTVRNQIINISSSSLFFWDDKLAEKNDLKGSSLEMRMEQLVAVSRLISENPLQGRGYGDIRSIAQSKGLSSDLRGLESILLEVLAQSGLVGLIIWLRFLIFNYKCSVICRKDRKAILFFHILYFISLLLTGIQSSFWAYMILCSILAKTKCLSVEKLKISSKYNETINNYTSL